MTIPAKRTFIVGMTLFTSGISLLIFSAFVNSSIGAVISFIIFLSGIAVLNIWHTKNYNWKCGKCGVVFSISGKENLLGINGGINKKLLFCLDCGKRRWCNAVKKTN